MHDDYRKRLSEVHEIEDPAQRRDAARELLMRLDRARAETHDPAFDALRAEVQQEVERES